MPTAGDISSEPIGDTLKSRNSERCNAQPQHHKRQDHQIQPDASKKRRSVEFCQQTGAAFVSRRHSLRMRSDVPIGTCLSGGFNSSVIICMTSDAVDGARHQSANAVFGLASGDLGSRPSGRDQYAGAFSNAGIDPDREAEDRFNSPMPDWLNGPLSEWTAMRLESNVAALPELVDGPALRKAVLALNRD